MGVISAGLNTAERYVSPKWRHEHWLSKPLRIPRNVFHSNRQYGRTQRLGAAILFIGRLFRYFVADLLYQQPSPISPARILFTDAFLRTFQRRTDPQKDRAQDTAENGRRQETGKATKEKSGNTSPHCRFPGGAGGSRTRVQTRNPRAFYTLSRRLILLPRHGMRQPNRGPSFLIFARRTKRPTDYPQMNDTPYGRRLKGGTVLRDTRRTTAWGHAIKPIFLEN